MLDDIQNTQVLLLATVLLAACLAKLLVHPSPAAAAAAVERVHGVPLPDRVRRATALRQSRRLSVGVGLTEGTLALALLVTSHMSVRVATTVAFATATWVVGELRVHRPDAGCGCFGGLSAERVRRRSVVRATLFTAAAILALGAPHAGVEVLREGPEQVAPVFTVELALFAALSPELAALVRRRGRLGRRRPVTPCERRRSPLAETYARLHRSAAWAEAENSVASAVPVDVWREGCWRFVVFPARVDGRDTEIVFAVSTAERSRTVRAAPVPPPDPGTADPAVAPSGPAAAPGCGAALGTAAGSGPGGGHGSAAGSGSATTPGFTAGSAAVPRSAVDAGPAVASGADPAAAAAAESAAGSGSAAAGPGTEGASGSGPGSTAVVDERERRGAAASTEAACFASR